MDEPQHAPPSPPVRVFLLDDHEVVRRGLHDLIDAEPDMEVVGEAGTSAPALVRGPALRPDVAILDVRLPDSDGITVCRELRSRMPGLARPHRGGHSDTGGRQGLATSGGTRTV